MTIFRYILQFLLLKSDKRGVWDSKRPLRMKWQLSDFGEKRGFPNFPQNHCPCPHLKLWGFLGNLSLKIPKSLVLPIPEFSPKNLKTLSPSPPCPQISGTGRGFLGNGDTIGLTSRYYWYCSQIGIVPKQWVARNRATYPAVLLSSILVVFISTNLFWTSSK